jgi:hypothetical protein
MVHHPGWSAAVPASSASTHRLQFKALLGAHIFIPAGDSSDAGRELPIGTKLVFDYASWREGEIAYQPRFDDSRMVLRGEPLPPYSGNPTYQGAIQINVLVQRCGLCVLTSTSTGLYRTLDQLYDAYVLAPEAQQDQVPVYRLEESRPYTTKYRPDPMYSPVYTPVAWMSRDAKTFGKRLIPLPKVTLIPDEATAAVPATPPPESDQLFNGAVAQGELLPATRPQRSSKTFWPPKGPSWGALNGGNDLGDAIQL